MRGLVLNSTVAISPEQVEPVAKVGSVGDPLGAAERADLLNLSVNHPYSELSEHISECDLVGRFIETELAHLLDALRLVLAPPGKRQRSRAAGSMP